MILDLSRIRAPETAFDKVYPPSAFTQADEEYMIAAPVTLHLDIHKDGSRFRLAGGVQTTLELPCSRCLEPFTLPVDATFDVSYQPQSANVGEGELEVGEADLSTAFYENDQIDLGVLMREQFYLALPMKPLCREDCKGLCPECGTNLNAGTCNCRHEWTDSRLAALKALVKDEPKP